MDNFNNTGVFIDLTATDDESEEGSVVVVEQGMDVEAEVVADVAAEVAPVIEAPVIAADVAGLIDALIDGDGNDGSIRGTVIGRPVPMAQRRLYKGHYVNPSSPDLRRVANIMRQNAPDEPLRGPLRVELEFRFHPSPNQWDLWHQRAPDIDNLTKFMLDAMNQAGFYVDDRQVANLVVYKLYCHHDEESQTRYIVGRM